MQLPQGEFQAPCTHLAQGKLATLNCLEQGSRQGFPKPGKVSNAHLSQGGLMTRSCLTQGSLHALGSRGVCDTHLSQHEGRDTHLPQGGLATCSCPEAGFSLLARTWLKESL